MKISLPIEWRGAWVSLPVEVGYQRLNEQVDVLSVAHGDLHILPLLGPTDLQWLQWAIRCRMADERRAAAGLSHIPPELRDIAQEEHEAALRFSDAQKGVRHVL